MYYSKISLMYKSPTKPASWRSWVCETRITRIGRRHWWI